MEVKIDGRPVLSTYVQENGCHAAPVNAPPGDHVLEVKFDNDYFEPRDAFASGSPRAVHVRPQPLRRRDRAARLARRPHRAAALTRAAAGADSAAFAATRARAAAVTGAATGPDPAARAGAHTAAWPDAAACSAAARARSDPPPDPSPAPPPGPTPPPANSQDILWTGDAEKPWDDSVSDSRWPDNNEWVSYSCQSRDRFAQVTDRVAQGRRAYRIEVRDGDDSYGERCELENGNTDSSRLHHQILFHRGQEVWIAFQTYLPLDFSFAVDGAPVSFKNDGGLITQLKQLGLVRHACARDRVEPHRVRTAKQRGQHLRVRADAIAVAGADGARPVGEVGAEREVRHRPRPGLHRDLVRPGRARAAPDRPVPDFGHRVVGNRIYTHTQKSPTGHPDPACPAGRRLLARAHRHLPRPRRDRHLGDLARRLDGRKDAGGRRGQRLLA